MDKALWAISSSPGGPRSATPETALVIWRWPLEGANKGKTANEARRNETETGHEANKGNDRQATKHEDTKQNVLNRHEARSNEGTKTRSTKTTKHWSVAQYWLVLKLDKAMG